MRKARAGRGVFELLRGNGDSKLERGVRDRTVTYPDVNEPRRWKVDEDGIFKISHRNT
jgi:hypothetical protein